MKKIIALVIFLSAAFVFADGAKKEKTERKPAQSRTFTCKGNMGEQLQPAKDNSLVNGCPSTVVGSRQYQGGGSSTYIYYLSEASMDQGNLSCEYFRSSDNSRSGVVTVVTCK